MGGRGRRKKRQTEQAKEICVGLLAFLACSFCLIVFFVTAYFKSARMSLYGGRFVLLLAAVTFYGFFRIFFATPFVQSRSDVVDGMVRAAKRYKPIVATERRMKAVDLGSGDCRIVLALAQAGFEAHGYEINLPLVLLSWWRIWRHGLGDGGTGTGKGCAFVHWKSMWDCNMAEFDVVAFYQSDFVMDSLSTKLKAEMRSGSIIVCNMFKMNTWVVQEEDQELAFYVFTMPPVLKAHAEAAL